MSRQPVEHDLKVLAKFFDALDRNEKTFEVRLDDREFAVCDTLRLREWDVARDGVGWYTGRECRRRVTYKLAAGTDSDHPGPAFPAIKAGWCVLGIVPADQPTIRTSDQTIYIDREGVRGGFCFDVIDEDSAEGVAEMLKALIAVDAEHAMSLQRQVAAANIERVRLKAQVASTRRRLEAITDDFHPDSNADGCLALHEMRTALRALLGEMNATPSTETDPPCAD